MRIDSAFTSDYLKAADLQGQQIVMTIQTVAIEKIGQDKEQRPVLYFDEGEKGLILNKTNATTISEMYGLETDEWVGQKIALYEKMVEFQGKTVPSIRVKVPRLKPALVNKPLPPRQHDDDSDDIPF